MSGAEALSGLLPLSARAEAAPQQQGRTVLHSPDRFFALPAPCRRAAGAAHDEGAPCLCRGCGERRLSHGHAAANSPQWHRGHANALAADTVLPACSLPCPTSSPAGRPFVTPLVTGLWEHKPQRGPSCCAAPAEPQCWLEGLRLSCCRRSHSRSQGFSAYRCSGMLTPFCHLLSLHLLFTASPNQGNQGGFLALLSLLLLEITPNFYGSATLFIFCCGE